MCTYFTTNKDQCLHFSSNLKATANNTSSDTTDDLTYYTERCVSRLQPVWICSLYAYKLVVLVTLLYVTWRVRHVTIPSLKDSKRVLAAVYTAAVLGVVVLPVLVITSSSGGPVVRYAVGALSIWLALTFTITLLFIPNVRRSVSYYYE